MFDNYDYNYNYLYHYDCNSNNFLKIQYLKLKEDGVEKGLPKTAPPSPRPEPLSPKYAGPPNISLFLFLPSLGRLHTTARKPKYGNQRAKFWAVRRNGVVRRRVWDGAPKSGAPGHEWWGTIRGPGFWIQVFRVQVSKVLEFGVFGFENLARTLNNEYGRSRSTFFIGHNGYIHFGHVPRVRVFNFIGRVQHFSGVFNILGKRVQLFFGCDSFTRQPRTQTCTFEGPGASNTTKIPQEHTEREGKKNVVGEGRKREILGPPTSGPHFSRFPSFGAAPSGPPLMSPLSLSHPLPSPSPPPPFVITIYFGR